MYILLKAFPILFLFVDFCFQFELGIIMKILESTILKHSCFPTRPSTPFHSHQHTSPTAHRFHSHSRHTPDILTAPQDANTRHTFTDSLSPNFSLTRLQNSRWSGWPRSCGQSEEIFCLVFSVSSPSPFHLVLSLPIVLQLMY